MPPGPPVVPCGPLLIPVSARVAAQALTTRVMRARWARLSAAFSIKAFPGAVKRQAAPQDSAFGEESRNILGEPLWLFSGCEVPAAWHHCPLADIIEAFGPFTRGLAVINELVCEDGEPGWYVNHVIRT